VLPLVGHRAHAARKREPVGRWSSHHVSDSTRNSLVRGVPRLRVERATIPRAIRLPESSSSRYSRSGLASTAMGISNRPSFHEPVAGASTAKTSSPSSSDCEAQLRGQIGVAPSGGINLQAIGNDDPALRTMRPLWSRAERRLRSAEKIGSREARERATAWPYFRSPKDRASRRPSSSWTMSVLARSRGASRSPADVSRASAYSNGSRRGGGGGGKTPPGGLGEETGAGGTRRSNGSRAAREGSRARTDFPCRARTQEQHRRCWEPTGTPVARTR
jgi:hypothetical protein